MTKTISDPRSLSVSVHDRFSAKLSGKKLPDLQHESVSLEGAIEKIRAHEPSRGLAVTYSQIRCIEVFDESSEFDGREVAPEFFGIIFLPTLNVDLKRTGKTIRLLSDFRASSVSYWNLTPQEIYGLRFLRSKGDMELFIRDCEDRVFLLRIATTLYERNRTVSELAYEKAMVGLDESGPAPEGLFPELLSFIGFLRNKAQRDQRRAAKMIHDYQRFDSNGLAGVQLATLLKETGAAEIEYSDVIQECLKKILRTRPDSTAQSLCSILTFVREAQPSFFSIGDLLSQTCFAAQVEANKYVLAEILPIAFSLRASQDLARTVAVSIENLDPRPESLLWLAEQVQKYLSDAAWVRKLRRKAYMIALTEKDHMAVAKIAALYRYDPARARSALDLAAAEAVSASAHVWVAQTYVELLQDTQTALIVAQRGLKKNRDLPQQERLQSFIRSLGKRKEVPA